MSTYGWQAMNWASGWFYYGQNTENNVSTGNLSMPEAGTVTDIVFNCDQVQIGGSGPMVANGCLWDGSGALLAAGSQVTLSSAGQHSGPYSWHDSACSYALAAGATFRMGWWRDPHLGAGSNIFGYASGGSTLLGTTVGSSGPGAFGQDGSAALQIGIYIVYTPTPPPPTPTPPIPFSQAQSMLRTVSLQETGSMPR